MKKLSNYQQAKQALKTVAIEAKNEHPRDKHIIRGIINDYVSHLSVDYRLHVHQIFKLSDYACKLHPRD